MRASRSAGNLGLAVSRSSPELDKTEMHKPVPGRHLFHLHLSEREAALGAFDCFQKCLDRTGK